MNKYTIGYDLVKPGKNYDGLIARLEQLGAKRILLSQWALRTAMTAVQVRDDLMRFIDANDRLLVIGITGEAAWTALLITTDSFKQAVAA